MTLTQAPDSYFPMGIDTRLQISRLPAYTYSLVLLVVFLDAKDRLIHVKASTPPVCASSLLSRLAAATSLLLSVMSDFRGVKR